MIASPGLALHRWVERFPHALTIPDYVLTPALREHDALTFQARGQTEAMVMSGLRAAAARDLDGYARRRVIEKRIVARLNADGLLPRIADRMSVCRLTGQIGCRECADGSVEHVIAWDHKCGQARLCPDEAREEQVRLVERYAPAIIRWQEGAQGRQVQFAVLAWPNIKPGALAEYKRRMLREVADLLKRSVCRAVKGALVVQEDPLAARGDWNLHCNLILLVHGRFDWGAVRADWYRHTRALFPQSQSDFQTHFAAVHPSRITRSVLELIKYSAKHVTDSDSERDARGGVQRLNGASGMDALGGPPSAIESAAPKKAGAGPDGPAPGLIDWPSDRISEWWAAGLGFRRTRSYGALFRIPAPKFEPMRTEWVGRITFSSDRYEVRAQGLGGIDLIQDHKSGFSTASDGACAPIRAGAGPPAGGCSFLNQ